MLGQKPWYPQWPLFSCWGDQSSPTGKIPYFLPTCRWERGTVNACVFQRARFRGVSHRFVTPIQGYRVMDSLMLLAGFEFSVDVYGWTLADAASTGLF